MGYRTIISSVNLMDQRKKKTIFPPGFFSNQFGQSIDAKMSKELPFWEFISKKKQISSNNTVFCVFSLPDQTVLFQWFLDTTPLQILSNYVAFQLDKQENQILLFTTKNEKLNFSTLSNLDLGQSLRKKCEFIVRFTNS